MPGRMPLFRLIVLSPVAAGVVLAASVAGCGGSMSAGDMKQYAIRRPADDEEASPAAKANQPPAPQRAAPQVVDAPTSSAQPAADVAGPSTTSQPTAAAPTTSGQTVTQTSEAAPHDTEPPPDAPLTDTAAPPAEPLDPEAAARRTVENLTRIGQAFEAYAKDKGVYPARATFSAADRSPLLSWRVALLPYLGYEELYAQFRLDEPWNSRHNHALLAKIPAVYQSPERFDERTNYLVPVGGSSVFDSRRGIAPRHIEDGAGNCVLAIEVDEAVAVPWTEPREYDLDLRAPTKSLGSLRNGSLFVVWGGGEMGRVSVTAPQQSLKAMFTADGGENFVAGSIDLPLFPAAVSVQSSRAPAARGDAVVQSAIESSNGASGIAPWTPAGGAGDAALAALVAEYAQRSNEEHVRGNEREAALWFYASAVVGPAGGEWVNRYQWVPVLRRPAPRVRFGVGLDYRGARENAIQQAALAGARRGTARSNRGNGPWSMVTGELGNEIVRVLAAHCEKSGAEALVAESPPAPGRRRRPAGRRSILDTSHGAPLAPGVYFLAAAREAVLLAAARREGVDVLLIVDWRNAGHKWSAGLTLIDVVRGERLLSLPRVTSTALEESRTNPLAANPLVKTIRDLDEYLEENLVMEPLPEQLQPRHVVRRFDALAAGGEENPLRNLAEMRFYSERGLADPAQLLLAYQSLIGTKAGSELMLGDADVKVRLLKPWLPLSVAREGELRARRAALDD